MMNTEQLQQAGRLLYGDQWQSNLARSLSVDDRTVRRWVSGGSAIKQSIANDVMQLLKNNQHQINQFINQTESNMDIITKIKNAANINELCELLNEYENDFDSELGKPEDFLDYSNLPTFGDAPDNTEEAFSWSDNEMLIKNNGWELIDRDND